MALTPTQILDQELATIGLKPGANANQIKTALAAKYPGGLPTGQIDPRTGLPYTTATAKDAGSGNLFGIIIGGAAFGYGIGALVDSALAGAGTDAVIGAGDVTGAATDTGIGGGAVSDVAAGGAAGTAVTSAGTSLSSLLAKWGGSAVVTASIWDWLTTSSHWVRILEYVGGAILVYLGIKGLTGIETPSVADVAAVAK